MSSIVFYNKNSKNNFADKTDFGIFSYPFKHPIGTTYTPSSR